MHSFEAILLVTIFLIAGTSHSQGVQVSQELNATTGSWANCTALGRSILRHRPAIKETHPDSSFQIISCINLHYRIPKWKLQQSSDSSIIIGVLSSASNTGPARRKGIRSTWAYAQKNVLFIVAGPWEDIVDEYQRYQDLLWIDMQEIYDTETSTLTFKTLMFFNVMYHRIPKDVNQVGFNFLFKTDDDSYVDLEKLHTVLAVDERINYWGKCVWGKIPHRNKEIPWQKKWFISYEVYPESSYPPYCQGAGFAVSRKFLDCAVGRNHTAIVRYMPNEDVAVGLLAERCQVEPVNDERVAIRWNVDEEPDMTDKIVQHYVTTEGEMRRHHQSVTGVRGPILLL